MNKIDFLPPGRLCPNCGGRPQTITVEEHEQLGLFRSVCPLCGYTSRETRSQSEAFYAFTETKGKQ